MKWFMKSSNDAPRLISLSPLRHSDQQDGSYYAFGSVNTPSPSPRRPIASNGHSEFFPNKTITATAATTTTATADGWDGTSTISRKSRIGECCYDW